ncbi:hypothetical protein EGW08_006143 [Elysia chlorotica]|uniref:Tyrosine-protein kinase receptor n=1 Tax=Elysia chlorotica TaxID=188477 RepID=A0A3S0ZUG6_ELYCH|nr:hypothetical protein EGW08_006143 [Elysia chlorotica]
MHFMEFCVRNSLILTMFTLLQHGLSSLNLLACSETCICTEDLIYGGVNMVCARPDAMSSLRQMDIREASEVTSLYIEGQQQLTRLADGSFLNFTNLRNLTIRDSSLTELDQNVFEASRSLQYLNLENNTISDFPDSIIKNTNVTQVLLQNNPLRCHCSNAWLLKPPSNIKIFHSLCLPRKFDKSNGPISFLYSADHPSSPENMLKDCERTQLHRVSMSSATMVTIGENVTITCPLRNVNITWDMSNIRSQWRQKSAEELAEEEAAVEILNISEDDQFRIVQCKGENSTHTAQANIILAIPLKPQIKSIEFYGLGYNMKVRFTLVGWPLPTIQWVAESTNRAGEVNTTLSNINTEGEIQLWINLRPMPAHGTFLQVVATNSLGSHKRREKIVIEQLDFHHTPPPIPVPVDMVLVTTHKNQSHHPDDLITSKIALSMGLGVLGMGILVATCLIVKYRGKIEWHKKLKFLRLQSLGVYNLASRVDDMPLHDVIVDNPMYKDLYTSAALLSCPPSYIPKFKGVRRIPPKNISKRRLIGEGNFGLVFLGECADLEGRKGHTPVAIKTLKGDSSEALRKDFEREAELLTTFKHKNIVHLYGVCTEGESWMLVFEFMKNGDLHGYLRSRAPDTVKAREPDQPKVEVLTGPELLFIIRQIAKGLEFLTAQHFVHRDLATRNCFVGKDLTVKIGDFGLARDIYITDYYRIGSATMLPYRWLPLESIRFGKFTTKSDVWSFGVTMWEVFTYGQKPWCELSIPEMVSKIESGERLPRPQGCPESIYQLMVEGCWKLKESERYDMTKICDILLKIDLKLPEYLDIVG